MTPHFHQKLPFVFNFYLFTFVVVRTLNMRWTLNKLSAHTACITIDTMMSSVQSQCFRMKNSLSRRVTALQDFLPSYWHPSCKVFFVLFFCFFVFFFLHKCIFFIYFYFFYFPTVQQGGQVILTCIHCNYSFSPTLSSVATWVSRHSSQCYSAGSPCRPASFYSHTFLILLVCVKERFSDDN